MTSVIGKITIGILLQLYSFFLVGYTFSTLWGWFIVTKFGLQELLPHEAYGIALVVCYLHPIEEETEEKSYMYKILLGLTLISVKALLYLGLGKLIVLYYY